MRKAHILHHHDGTSLPEHSIFFDTETEDLPVTKDGIPSVLKIWTAVYHRQSYKGRKRKPQWCDGKTDGDFYTFVMSKVKAKSKISIFSANIWFDIRHVNILNNLLNYGYSINKFFDRGRTFYLSVKKGKSTIAFINIQNIIPFGVAKMGKMLGYEKGHVEFDNVSDEDLLKYCYRDTEIIYKTMLNWYDFIRSNDLGTFRPTIASQAFTAYLHRFLPQGIYVHDHEKAIALEREAYQGGRSESRFIGKVPNKKIYILDINSEYPFIMRDNDFPYKLVRYRKSLNIDNLYKLTDHYLITVRCKIDTDEPVYGHTINKRLCFPIGKFTQVLSTASFRYGYEHGHIKEVSDICFYEKFKLFRKWVEELYKARVQYRKDKNTVYVTLVKLLMNSLYGKFGQRGDTIIKEENVDNIDYKSESVYDADAGAWHLRMQIGDFVRESLQMTEEGFNSFPAIAAHVTDYARIYLWCLIKQAKFENVYYMDTDSLFVNEIGLKNLKDKISLTELGKLKLEKTVTDLTINGIKDYVADRTVKHKGVPHNAKPISNDTYEYLFFPGLRTDIHNGLDKNYTKKYVRKTLKREYTKGTVSDSGYIKPFELNDW